MCGRGVELGSQEAGLAPILIAVHQSGNGESPLHDLHRILLRRLHFDLVYDLQTPQCLSKIRNEYSILRLVLEALLPPLRDCGAVEDNHIEVRIEHKNDVGLNRRDVEQDGRERSVQRVRH